MRDSRATSAARRREAAERRHSAPSASFYLVAAGAAAALAATVPACAPLPAGTGVSVTAGPRSDQWEVRWDPVLGTPSAMRNRSLESAPGPQGGPAIDDAAATAAAQSVFRDRADWFRIRPGLDELRTVRSYSQGWLRFVRVAQVYRGVPVAGGGYDIRVLPNGRVGSIDGRFYPDLHVEITPVLSALQARDRARTLFAPGTTPPADAPWVQFEYENGFTDPSVLAIVPRSAGFVLAWGVVVQTGARENTRVYVDAASGEAIGRQSVGIMPAR